jgi:uncharacterized protein (DUF1501 family)
MMIGQARTIRRPALLGVVAAAAMVAALAASWGLQARAEALRPGWGAKAVLLILKGPADSELTAETPADF